MRRARRPIFFGCRSSSWRHPLKSCPRPPHSVGQVSLRPHCQARGEEYTLMVNASLCALSCLGVLAPAVHPAAVTHARSDPGSLCRRTCRSATARSFCSDCRSTPDPLPRPARSVAASARSMQEARPGDRPASPSRAWPGDVPGVILSPPVPLCGAGDAAYLDVHVRGCNRGVADRLPRRAGRRREAL